MGSRLSRYLGHCIGHLILGLNMDLTLGLVIEDY